jgi:hypothetical protein
MRFRRTLTGVLVALMAAALNVGFAMPASAAVPGYCEDLGFSNGRSVRTDNDGNGGGAYVVATLCWTRTANGFYRTHTSFTVEDTAANGAGATIRIEWTGTDGATYYYVPIPEERAWSKGEIESAEFSEHDIKALYVRACLTNANNPAHHCGPKS